MADTSASVWALRALRAWGVREADLELVRDRDNTTFAVSIDGKRRYALRVCRPHPHRISRAAREFAWLRALQRDTNLPLAQPHAMYVDATDGRVCLAFRWVDGEPLDVGRLTVKEARAIGRIAATLHRHARTWPTETMRSSLRLREIGRWRASSGYKVGRARPSLTSSETAVIDAAERMTRGLAEALVDRDSSYGLIHADLTADNCILLGNEVTPIDFADTSFGFFLYDIAIFLASIYGRADRDALGDAYFDGYGMILRPPRAKMAVIDRLIIVRLVSQVIWLVRHAPEPQFGPADLARAKLQIAEIDTLLGRLKATG